MTKTFFDKHCLRNPHLTEEIMHQDLKLESKIIVNELVNILNLSAENIYGKRTFFKKPYEIKPFIRFALITYLGGITFDAPTTLYGIVVESKHERKSFINLRYGRWVPLIDIPYFKKNGIVVESIDNSFLDVLRNNYQESNLKKILDENDINLKYDLRNKFSYE